MLKFVRPSNRQVMTSCVPPVTQNLPSHEALTKKQQQGQNIQVPPTPKGIMSSMKPKVTKNQDHTVNSMRDLDLTYITERIIAMFFPETGVEGTYRNSLKEMAQMLKTKHGEKYRVFNLSERRYDLTRLYSQILDFGWPDHLAPPLERLCSICKFMDSWLNANPNHVVVLHCKGGRGRLGVVIAAYMYYSNICASADQDLDRFAMKKFYDDKLVGATQPSQRRYAHYFAGLLSGTIKINSNPLYLLYIRLHDIPNLDATGGCRPFVKIYQAMQPVYTSGVYSVTPNMNSLCISLDQGLQLRGDILVKCYHKKFRPSASRDVIFCCQFHTCAISDSELVFNKEELDDVCNDERFPIDFRLELVFSSSLHKVQGYTLGSQCNNVPVDNSADPLIHWDSYENFNAVPEDRLEDINYEEDKNVQVKYTEGPVDGSLYAIVNKKKTEGATTVQNVSTLPNGPHTASMDSGISSASGNAGNVVSTTTASPPPTQVSYTVMSSSSGPRTVASDTQQLDEILNGIMAEIEPLTTPKSQQMKIYQDNIQTLYKTPNIYASINGYPQPCISPTSSPIMHHQDSNDLVHPDKRYVRRNKKFTYGIITSTPQLKTTSPTPQRKVVGDERLAASPSPPTVTFKNPVEEEIIPKSDYNPTSGCSSTVNQKPQPLYTNLVSQMVHPTFPALETLDSSLNQLSDTFAQNSSLSPDIEDIENISWLEQQKLKLKARKEGYDKERELQEKLLIAELRNAQNKMTIKRAHSDAEEELYPLQSLLSETTTNTTFSTVMQPNYNEPLHVQTAYPTYSVNVQPTSQSPYTANKPPIYQSPRMSSAPSSPIIPSRSSSRDVMNRRGFTTQQKPLQRQRSDTSFDRDRPFVQLRQPRTTSGNVATSTTSHSAISQMPNMAEIFQQPQYAIPTSVSSPQKPEIYTLNSISSSSITTTYHPTELGQKSPELEKSKISDSKLVTSPGSPGTFRLEELEQTLQVVGGSTSPLDGQLRARSISPEFRPVVITQRKETIDYRQSPQSYSGEESTSPQSSPSQQGARPTTPAFPVGPRTPYVNHETIVFPQQSTSFFSTTTGGSNSVISLSPGTNLSPTGHVTPGSTTMGREQSPTPQNIQALRADLIAQQQDDSPQQTVNGQSSPSIYYGQSRRSSLTSLTEPMEVIHHHPVFVKDTSKYWYKPNISREEAITMLKDRPPGTFVVRDSNSFPGAFGLALKVATPPPNVQNKTGDISNELVRHFLIEPTAKGVKLKGCSNEPVFGSLSALVYQHSITPLALPCKLILPESDPALPDMPDLPGSAQALLAQGAGENKDLTNISHACNVLYLNSVDTESLTGPQAVRRAMAITTSLDPRPIPTVVHFKVSSQGITLTDNQRKLFFRRHYPVTSVTYCGMDPDDRRCFGFVARKPTSKTDNQCHVFAELEPEQPASAIVNFVSKVMMAGLNIK